MLYVMTQVYAQMLFWGTNQANPMVELWASFINFVVCWFAEFVTVAM